MIELIAVLVIVSIMSVAIAPAISSMDRMADAGLNDEIARRLALARAYSMSTGNPAGLQIDDSAGALNLLHIPAAGAAPTPLPGASGADDPNASLAIEAIYPGTAVASLDIDPSGSYDTVWFDFQGEPHLRTGAGAFDKSLEQDAVISTAGGSTVTVRRITGAIQ